jgi:hypothetical protein
MQLSSVLPVAVLATAVSAANSTVTTHITQTDYTTYCPEPTTVTITTCVEDVCHPHLVTVTKAETITVTGPCVVPTTYTTHVPQNTTINSHSTHISTFVGGAQKNVAGALAGVAMVAALL